MKKIIFKAVALGLLTVMICAFSACSNISNPNKTVKALEEAGYVVVYNDGEGEFDAATLPKGAKASIMAYKGKENIHIIYYEDAATADAAWEDVNQIADFHKDQEGFVCEKSGSVIYYGTEQALEDAK